LLNPGAPEDAHSIEPIFIELTQFILDENRALIEQAETFIEMLPTLSSTSLARALSSRNSWSI
jgi:hypothetical protein